MINDMNNNVTELEYTDFDLKKQEKLDKVVVLRNQLNALKEYTCSDNLEQHSNNNIDHQ